MKKQYMKPTVKAVNIRQSQMLCTSPNNLSGRSISSYSGSEEQIDDPDEIR